MAISFNAMLLSVGGCMVIVAEPQEIDLLIGDVARLAKVNETRRQLTSPSQVANDKAKRT